MTRLAVPVPISDGETCWVMHPFLSLRSRAHNVLELGHKYNNNHGRSQLQASVHCLRHYILELAAAGTDDAVKEARAIATKVFMYAAYSNTHLQSERSKRPTKKPSLGPRLYRQLGIDPFDAVPCDPALGEMFVSKTYPRWQADCGASARTTRIPANSGSISTGEVITALRAWVARPFIRI